MRVLITTLGTRGDIQPFIALGRGLQRAGHEVALCTAEGFRSFVEEYGLAYAYLNNEILELMLAQDGQSLIDGSGDRLALIRMVKPIMRRAMDDEWQAAQSHQPDVIIYHPKALGSYHIAEKLDIPLVLSLPLPLYTPTSAFPSPMLPDVQLGGWFNRLSYRLLGLATSVFAATTNDFRTKTLNLPARGRFASFLHRANGEPIPVLYHYSRHVLPVPADYPSHVHVTGYWFLDQSAGWQPLPELVRFLKAGPPPVYIGFGSMGGVRVASRTETVLGALAKSGQRGLLASGWGGLAVAELPDNVLAIEAAPHDWLFPRMAGVVHHGGAGTTAAGLRAGKPTLICPFIADQPFWGKIVHKLGAGPPPIPQKKLTADGLAAAIDKLVHDPALAQRAAEIGEKIAAENGVAWAVEILERIVATKEAV